MALPKQQERNRYNSERASDQTEDPKAATTSYTFGAPVGFLNSVEIFRIIEVYLQKCKIMARRFGTSSA